MDDKPHVASYLQMWYEDIHHALDRKSFCGSLPSLVMVAVSLDFYQTHVQEFPTQLRHGHEEATSFLRTVVECMCKVTPRMASYISSPTTSDHVVYAAGVFVSSMASYTNAFRQWGNEASSKSHPVGIYRRQLTRTFLAVVVTDELMRSIESYVSRQADLHPSETESLTKLALDAMRTTQRDVESSRAANLLATYLTPGIRSILSQQRRHVSNVLAVSESLGLDDKASVINALINQAAENPLDRQSLLLLQGLVAPKADANSQGQEHFSTALSQAVSHLSDKLLQPQPFDISMLSLQTIDIILRKH
ncbi:MAG: hypothetical protein Q9207_007288, partial [Kuettlingeria erythrocarpa]